MRHNSIAEALFASYPIFVFATIAGAIVYLADLSLNSPMYWAVTLLCGIIGGLLSLFNV